MFWSYFRQTLPIFYVNIDNDKNLSLGFGYWPMKYSRGVLHICISYNIIFLYVRLKESPVSDSLCDNCMSTMIVGGFFNFSKYNSIESVDDKGFFVPFYGWLFFIISTSADDPINICEVKYTISSWSIWLIFNTHLNTCTGNILSAYLTYICNDLLSK